MKLKIFKGLDFTEVYLAFNKWEETYKVNVLKTHVVTDTNNVHYLYVFHSNIPKGFF